MKIVAYVCLAFFAANIEADQVTDVAPKPNTKVEAFAAQVGSVIIKGYTKLGVARGDYGSVEVQAMEFANANSGKKEYGVLLQVNEAGRLEREHRSYIDYDEIASLLNGIDYVAKTDKSATKL